jgi:hypothetical protein
MVLLRCENFFLTAGTLGTQGFQQESAPSVQKWPFYKIYFLSLFETSHVESIRKHLSSSNFFAAITILPPESSEPWSSKKNWMKIAPSGTLCL